MVIDQSPELIAHINDNLEAQGIVGHAAHPETLKRAGAAQADMLIAVTMVDEVNMVACQVAQALFNVPLKIARIRQQSYLDPVWGALFGRDRMSIDVVISPELEIASAIERRIRVPGAFEAISLSEDRVRVIGAQCGPETPIINTPLRQLTAIFPDLKIAILAIFRGESLIIPSSTERMLEGDDVYFVVETEQVARAMSSFGYEAEEIRRIVILGGGAIGAALARMLRDGGRGYSVQVVEQSRQQARAVAEALPEIDVTCGDALDRDILEEAGLAAADEVVAVTNHDETNILASLLAKRIGAGRAFTLLNRTGYGPLIGALGIDAVISPREITASTIMRHVRQGRIRSVNALRDGRAEILETELMTTSPLVGRRIDHAGLPRDALIGAIVRGDRVLIARPDLVMESKDIVVLIASTAVVKKVEAMLAVRPDYF